MTLRVLFPFHCNNEHAGHLPFSLVRHLSQTDLHAELWVTGRGARAQADFVRTILDATSHSLLRRVNQIVRPAANWPLAFLEHCFLRAFRKGDMALLSRGTSLGLTRALRARGHMTFLERINTMDHTAKAILEDAFSRAGWPIEHMYTQDSLDREKAQAEAANFIFSASPAVTNSLIERGISKDKILECSYGWDPHRFIDPAHGLPAIPGITVLFVGGIGVRKGAHLLLHAWSKADIAGRLVLLGHMERAIKRHCADIFLRSDVVHVPYSPDPGPWFNSADIFALPTLEEGSPLVAYEATGNGLPVLSTPMGAGWIVRNGVEGRVIEPYDEAGWIAALRLLAGDAALRKQLGHAGRICAAHYTWTMVAQRRYGQIKGVMTGQMQ